MLTEGFSVPFPGQSLIEICVAGVNKILNKHTREICVIAYG